MFPRHRARPSRPSRRHLSTPARSRHAAFYSDTLPAMMPVFLLGSAVYLGLRLAQMQLVHEKFVEGAEARIQALETEIAQLEHHRSLPQQEPEGSSPATPSKRWSLW